LAPGRSCACGRRIGVAALRRGDPHFEIAAQPVVAQPCGVRRGGGEVAAAKRVVG
jgi:hypothetical protein